MRKLIPLFVFALVFLEVSTLKLGRNTDNSEVDVEDVLGPPLDIMYYSNLSINKTKLNPEGIEVSELELLESGFIEESRNLIYDDLTWPGAVIPYTIDASFSEQQKGIIARAMQRILGVSCIHLKGRTYETDYVHITRSGEGCFSNFVGKLGGKQIINLDDSCFRRPTGGYATALHEILHVAGFWHQQSAPDRDEYVKINYENIIGGEDGSEWNFDKKDSRTFNEPYDYCSIMQYSAYAGSKNRKPTIEKKKSYGCNLYYKTELSDGDIRKMKLLYPSIRCGVQGLEYYTSTGFCDLHKDWVTNPSTRKYYKVINSPMRWISAVRECHKLGAELAYITEPQDMQFVQSIARHHYRVRDGLWLGGTDIDQATNFYWINGAALSQYDRAQWAPGQPDNYRGNEHCLQLWGSNHGISNQYLLNDASCEHRQLPLCMKQK